MKYRNLTAGLAVLLAAATVSNAQAQKTTSHPEPECKRRTRDPFLAPFSDDSIWNTPIGSKARYILPGVFPTTGYYSGDDIELFFKSHKNDPAAPIYAPYEWTQRCEGTLNQVGPVTLKIPASLIVPDSIDANGVFSTPNNAAAFLLDDDRTVFQIEPLARCEAGGPIYGFYDMQHPTQDIYGPGPYGTHFGSGLSAFGGSIRYGELTGSAPITHSLHLEVSPDLLYYSASSPTPGYRWPADRTDGSAPDNYLGTNPSIVMGTLTAIPPTITAASLGLQTVPGRKLFLALQNYGAYIVDNTGDASYAFGLQKEADGEFLEHYGFPFYGDVENSTTPAQLAWISDYQKLIQSLAVVDNNTEGQPGGPGRRLAPYALPFGAQDKTPPTTPNGLQATALRSESASVQWTPSTDNVQVMQYLIFNGGQQIGQTYGATSLLLNSLQPGTHFSIQVEAVDTSLNVSKLSKPLSFSTPNQATNNFEEFFQGALPNWTLTSASDAPGYLLLANYGGAASAIYTGAGVADGFSLVAATSGQGGNGGNVASILFNYQDAGDTYAFEFTGAGSGYSRVVKYQGGNATVLGYVSGYWFYPTTEIDVDSAGNITVSGISGGQKTMVYSGIQDTTYTAGSVGFASLYNYQNVSSLVVSPLQQGPNNFEQSFQGALPNWTLTNASDASGYLALANYGGAASAIYTGAAFADGFSLVSDTSGQGGSAGNVASILFNYQDAGDTYAFEFTGANNGYSRVVRYQGGNATVLGYVSGYWSYPTTEIDVDSGGNITVSGISGGLKTVVYTCIQDTTYTTGEVGFASLYNTQNVSSLVISPL